MVLSYLQGKYIIVILKHVPDQQRYIEINHTGKILLLKSDDDCSDGFVLNLQALMNTLVK